MMTETRLQAALDKIDRRLLRKPPGRPMSGLSIPADYYFPGRKTMKTTVVRGRKAVRSGAGR